MNKLECVIVMPAYNEELCIGRVLLEWITACSSQLGEAFKIVVVNDGSTDRTGEILDSLATQFKELMILHQDNAGHGNALLKGYHFATSLNPNYVFHVDSDDQFSSQDFQALWKIRFSSPFVLGFRSVRNDPVHRLLITRVLKLLNFIIFGVWISDSNIPFRLIETDYLKRLLSVIPNDVFAPNIHLSLLASCLGAAVQNIPVRHSIRKTGAVSIVRWRLIKVCFRCLKELILFRFNLYQTLDYLKNRIAPSISRRIDL